ncbi:MAG: FAD-dependent oxidoreductase [Thermoanaerobaculales bacterium]|jgi:protoporphyrinogen oxidase|nr:FAD-dependent oxidoreductase [Thermoanaerobaculales bacterium]
MTQTPHITVLGGGPAGLAAGAAARALDLGTTLFEADRVVGGTCRTIEVDGFRFDTGAHRVHDKDPAITEWLTRELGDRLHQVDAPSRIWDDGRWLDFPINAPGLVRHLGLGGSCLASVDLAYRRVKARKAADSFLDFALRAYGRPVAERFLLNYSEKLWGEAPERLSTEIAGSRLAGLDLRTVLAETLSRRRRNHRHVEGRFLYPRGGIGAVPTALATTCGRENIRTDSPIQAMEHDGERITAVRTNGSDPIAVDRVVSSLPLSTVAGILDPQPPAAVIEAAGRLRFRQVILVALFVDRPSLTDAATVYFPDRRFGFTRLCEPRNRCATMAPKGRTSVVVEIPCFRIDPVWRASDDELVSMARKQLAGAGLFQEHEVPGGVVRRQRNAYPVLETGISDAVSSLRKYLRRFSNLSLVGRNGTFTYGWIHDMIAGGRRAVDSIAASA